MVGAIVIEGHVQGLSNTRSLGELGIPVYVVDTVHCLAQHSKYCKKYYKCPPYHSAEFIDFLLDLSQILSICSMSNRDCIITVIHFELTLEHECFFITYNDITSGWRIRYKINLCIWVL